MKISDKFRDEVYRLSGKKGITYQDAFYEVDAKYRDNLGVEIYSSYESFKSSQSKKRRKNLH